METEPKVADTARAYITAAGQGLEKLVTTSIQSLKQNDIKCWEGSLDHDISEVAFDETLLSLIRWIYGR